jgi:hypothetical protein
VVGGRREGMVAILFLGMHSDKSLAEVRQLNECDISMDSPRMKFSSPKKGVDVFEESGGYFGLVLKHYNLGVGRCRMYIYR